MRSLGILPRAALVAAIGVCVVGALFLSPEKTLSQGAVAMTGYAWSDTIGWISLSCSNDNTCGTSNYGITIAVDGTMSGYAWNDNAGWISAQSADLSGCPTAPCTARMNEIAMQGWMKALSANNAQSGGWDGFISLSGASYGATLNTTSGNLTGYAWGDMNVGWVSWNSGFNTVTTTWRPVCAAQYSCVDSTTRQNACAGAVPEACTSGFVCSTGSCVLPAPPSASGAGALTVTPRLVRPGGTVVVSWDVANATSCSVTEDRTTMSDSWSGISSAVSACTHSGTGCRTSAIPGVVTYTLTCSGLGGNLTQTATVNTTPQFKEI